MHEWQTKARSLRCLLFMVISLSVGPAAADERLHILIPGGAGGGWDSTGRGIGDVLARSGLVTSASYENMSGGGGSKAIAYLIETADRQHNTLMVSSTPVVLNALRGIFPQTYRDLIPIASAIADYGAFAVRADSHFQNWQQVIRAFQRDPRSVKVAGGSVRGSMDHLVAALAVKNSGGDPRELRYIPYNAGAKAMVGLLSGETQVLSSGLSEVIALAEQGEVRVLAMTGDDRADFAPSVPTLVEQGVDVQFANWRGFFAAPAMPLNQQRHYQAMMADMYGTAEWEVMRMNRGWADLYIPGEDFEEFLRAQEEELGQIMQELGMK